MPTYKFMCVKCGMTREVQHVPITADKEHETWPTCPAEKCGGEMNKTWIGPEGGFILKGRGWFNKGGY